MHIARGAAPFGCNVASPSRQFVRIDSEAVKAAEARSEAYLCASYARRVICGDLWSTHRRILQGRAIKHDVTSWQNDEWPKRRRSTEGGREGGGVAKCTDFGFLCWLLQHSLSTRGEYIVKASEFDLEYRMITKQYRPQPL